MALSRRDVLQGALAAGAVAAVPAEAAARERKQPPPDAMGMLYDATLCVGCRACVARCKEANKLPPDARKIDGVTYDAPDDLSWTNKTVIRLHREEGKSSFMKAQCMHCVDPACVSVCMLGALHKSERGVVAYRKDRCLGCRYCQVACAYNIPKFQWHSAVPQIVKCEMCRTREGGPACAEICPREAIRYAPLVQLKQEAHRRIVDNPGRYINHVYGEEEGGGTQVLYLSAMPFEKLGLPRLGEEPVPEMSETVQHAVYKGFIAPAALYGALAFVILRNRKQEHAAPLKKEAGHE
jgi:Fe-S-cluster-containing dehydrogenase component